jgi:eukaryotic-like serine/threonine-protein kinase
MTPAGRIVGNYALGAVIGRGAMSEVWAARHRFLGDAVAVKLLRAGPAEDEDAFVAEAARTRAIAHENVVRVLDFGRDDASGSCYLVMERIEGETLAERLRGGPLSEAEVRALGAALADGMQAAHERGIVHRDLKPANVMLQGAVPKIVDFGIAKHLGDQSAATTARRVGTPAYMAPEQLTGGLIAPFVDVWALGVILFEAVTGRLPFDGFDDGRCPQLFEAAPRARSVEGVVVSTELDALIARCLEREPGRRPSSMAEVARVLRGEGGAERITQDAGPLPAAARPSAADARAPLRGRGVLFALAGVALVAGVAYAVTHMRAGAAAGDDSAAADPTSLATSGVDAGAAAAPPDAAEIEIRVPAPEPERARDRERPARPRTRAAEPPPPPLPPPPRKEGLD